jgi:peptidoglycan hydrolase-like protein with peptidoglycan-binding domain
VTRHRTLLALVLGLTLAGVLGLAAERRWDRPSASSASAPTGLATAVVRRTTLVDTQLIGGTLAYRALPPLIGGLAGTLTALPGEGTTIQPGHVLYRVDNRPVLLLRGTTPAWRTLEPWEPAGPDVAELNRNLIALGYEPARAEESDQIFDWETERAVEELQHDLDEPETGVLPLGSVIVRPTGVRVGARLVPLGGETSAGSPPFAVTTSRRAVSASIDAADVSLARRGASVSIVLASGRTTPGRITAVGHSLTGAAASASLSITVTPIGHPRTGQMQAEPVEVALTTNVARDVIAAPISALLALAGGGYGVETVEPGGAHRLVRVRTGLFSHGLVALRGVALGARVVVAQ